MKLLVLGIDGGDRRIIRAMDMPFTQKLISERVQINIQEDLWSRGWSEVSSGLHGIDTGAFYAKPKLNGTPEFTQSYNYTDYKNNPDCTLVWEKLNQLGYKVGFINMPTTIPAPQVDGFFISGAGAGYSPSSRVPEVACHPQHLAYELLKVNYTWEQRYRISGIRDFDVFIDNCIQAVAQRTEIFVKLSKQFHVDAGFVMHREFSTITNLFQYLIEPLLDIGHKSYKKSHLRIGHFFRVLDDHIRVAVTELSPEHILITSDHSVSPYKYSLNLNAFLARNKFLIDQIKSPEPRILKRYKHIVGENIRKSIVPHYPDRANTWYTQEIDFTNSVAFSSNYVPGIYLNDERFLKRVATSSRETLLRNIIDAFNGTEEAKQFKLYARPYREQYVGRLAYNYLPDIWIDIPDMIFPEQKGRFVQPNPYFQSYENLDFAERDLLSGIKGRKALCHVEKEFLYNIDTDDSHDLTVAYQLILNHFRH